MALNTIAQIKLLNGKVIDLVDWTDMPLFSSLDIQSGTTQQEMTLFNYVSGDTVPGYAPVPPTNRTSTENDTNVAAPGTMSAAEELLIYAIKPEVYFYSMDTAGDFNTRSYLPQNTFPGLPLPTAQGLAVLFQQLILELEISEKKYAQATLGYFNPGFGVMKVQGNGSASTGAHGLPSQGSVRSFVIPHHIGAEEKYKVTLRNSSEINDGALTFGIFEGIVEGQQATVQALTCATIRINLDGLYKRPVS